MNNMHPTRDQEWLNNLLELTWSSYFSDVKRVNNLRIEFGRRAKRRLGSISVDAKTPRVSVIRVNGWFRDPTIPEWLVQSVIVHELCHYAHGFNSGASEKVHRHPHAGGVIRREFSERSLGSLYDRQQDWLKHNWPSFIARNHRSAPRRQRTRPTKSRRVYRFLFRA